MKNIFKKIPALVFVASLLLSGVTAFAQPDKVPPGGAGSGDKSEKKEQIEAMRIAFITQKLALTREEAQKFWPVYNEYRDGLNKMRGERHDSYKSYKASFESLSDKEYGEYVDNQIIFRQRELDLLKKYHAEFKSVLPIKKVALLYRAEDEFKKNLLKEVHERKAD